MFCKYLQEEGIKVRYTEEPYHDDLIPLIGKYSNGDLINSPVLMYLLAADRYIHVKDIISWKQEGMFVVSDRYVLSSWVYQQIQGIPLKTVRRTNSFAINPDLTFYIDVPLEERFTRIPKTHKGIRSFFLENTNLIKEQELYHRLTSNWDEKRYGKIVVINGQQGITEIHRIIVDLVQNESI